MLSISDQLKNHTASISNFDKTRNYISLSHILLPVEEIISQYKSGYEDTLNVRLKCYKGYQMEKDMLRRIVTVFGDQVKLGVEVEAFDGLVKGHPDFAFNSYPADCKSVLKDEWLPTQAKIPRRIYWQMQSYMKYSGTDKALLIFESRESGDIADFWIRANTKIQTEIHDKLTAVVKAVKGK